MKISRTQWIVAGIGVLALLTCAIIVAMWFTRPERTLTRFLEAVKKQDIAAAQALVATDITERRKDDISFFLEDWTFDSTTVYAIEKEHAAWRSREKKNDAGEVVKDADGDPVRETRPTTRFWAHHYEQYVTVAFDEYEDPVIIRLRREGENTWSRFAQLFKPWKVVDIRYQPLSEEDIAELEADSTDEFFEDEE